MVLIVSERVSSLAEIILAFNHNMDTIPINTQDTVADNNLPSVIDLHSKILNYSESSKFNQKLPDLERYLDIVYNSGLILKSMIEFNTILDSVEFEQELVNLDKITRNTLKEIDTIFNSDGSVDDLKFIILMLVTSTKDLVETVTKMLNNDELKLNHRIINDFYSRFDNLAQSITITCNIIAPTIDRHATGTKELSPMLNLLFEKYNDKLDNISLQYLTKSIEYCTLDDDACLDWTAEFLNYCQLHNTDVGLLEICAKLAKLGLLLTQNR